MAIRRTGWASERMEQNRRHSGGISGAGANSAYDDTFDGSVLDSAWTQRNSPPSVVVGSGRLILTVAGSAGCGLIKALPAFGTQTTIYLRVMVQRVSLGGMLGLHLLDGSGNGCGLSWYNNGYGMLGSVSTAYTFSAGLIVGAQEFGDYWLKVKSTGTVSTVYAAPHTEGLPWYRQPYVQQGTTSQTFTPAFALIGTAWTNGSGGIIHARDFHVEAA